MHRGSLEDLHVAAQPLVLPPQGGQLVAFGAGQPAVAAIAAVSFGLPDPFADRGLGQVKVAGDLPDRAVTLLAQLHNLGLELGRERPTRPRPMVSMMDILPGAAPLMSGVRQTGSGPGRQAGCWEPGRPLHHLTRCANTWPASSGALMHPHRNYPRQPVGWGTFTETPPPVLAPNVEPRPADWLLLAVLRPAWAYRLELCLIVLLAVAYVWLGGRLGREDADRVIVAAAFVVALLGWTREPLARGLARSHVRRRWALACRHAELASRNDRVPWVMRCVLARAGEQLRVRLPAGAQVPDLEQAAERLAAFLAVREVRVSRDPANARYAKVVILRRDPLADPQPIPWPLLTTDRCSLWHPIPVGEDEDGNQVEILLPERNLLLGAEPGGGKSTVAQLLIATAALDDSAKLVLFDPKLVELSVWQGCCDRLVGPNVEEAIEVLKELIAELDDRYLTLLANRARKVAEGDGLPLYLVVIEELAYFTNGPDRRPRPRSRSCCATSW